MFDRLTDRILIARCSAVIKLGDRICIACSAVIKLFAIAYVFLFSTCMKISFKNLHALLKYQQKPQVNYASLCMV